VLSWGVWGIDFGPCCGSVDNPWLEVGEE